MTQQSWHRTQAQNPDREPYELAYHQRQARLLADPDAIEAMDPIRLLYDAAEMIDDDDLQVLSDSGLAALFARVDVARDQCEAELDRRRRRRMKK